MRRGLLRRDVPAVQLTRGTNWLLAGLDLLVDVLPIWMAQTLQASCTEDRERNCWGPGGARQVSRRLAISQTDLDVRLTRPSGRSSHRFEWLRTLRIVATAAPPWRGRGAHCGQVKEAHRSGCSTPPSSRRWNAVRDGDGDGARAGFEAEEMTELG